MRDDVRTGEGRGREGEAFAAWAGAIPPFDLLDAPALRSLGAAAVLGTRGKGAPVVPLGTTGLVAVLRSGCARLSVRPGGGEELPLAERGPGRAFGLFPPAPAGVRFGAVALEDCEAYLLEGAPLAATVRRFPAFADFFLLEVVTALLDRWRSGAAAAGGGGRSLRSTPVGDLCGPRAVTAPAQLPVREAAVRMTRHRTSSLVVLDEDGAPAGIVTDRDLRASVVAAGASTASPVGLAMSPAPVGIDAGAPGFEALLEMTRRGIHHLLVTEGGRLRCVVTNHDLLILQGASPLALVRDVEAATDVDEVAAAAARTQPLLALLVEQGVRASGITRLVTEVNDRLVRTVLRLAEAAVGPAPLPWCWIAFGSEGRREQTFRTDQDNALILADAASPGEEAAAAAWAERFAEFVNAALVRAGFPPCPGGYMARTPRWRQPLRVWREYFTGWIGTPTPEAILAAVILFDFRPVAGEAGLGAQLRDLVSREAPRHPIFLKHLASLAAGVRPPLGLFGRLRVERGGDQRGTIDLKRRCLAPLINVVRLYAMEHGVALPGTLERLEALRRAHPAVVARGEEIAQAFEFLSLLRLRAQLRGIEAGDPPANAVDPRRLAVPERRGLRDASQLILELQGGIARHYNPGSRL